MSSRPLWTSALFRALGPLDHPDLHGFFKWVSDALDVRNDFVRQEVTSRRDAGWRTWGRWLHEDLGTRSHQWLRADFVPPSAFLVVEDREAETCRILVEPHLVGAEFRETCMPYFCRSGHPVVTVSQFLDFVDPYLPQEPVIDLPGITGQDLFDVAGAKKSTAGGLDGWAWKQVKALPLAWCSGLAVLLSMVESTGVGSSGGSYCNDSKE